MDTFHEKVPEENITDFLIHPRDGKTEAADRWTGPQMRAEPKRIPASEGVGRRTESGAARRLLCKLRKAGPANASAVCEGRQRSCACRADRYEEHSDRQCEFTCREGRTGTAGTEAQAQTVRKEVKTWQPQDSGPSGASSRRYWIMPTIRTRRRRRNISTKIFIWHCNTRSRTARPMKRNTFPV